MFLVRIMAGQLSNTKEGSKRCLFFNHCSFHSLINYFLSTYYVPGILQRSSNEWWTKETWSLYPTQLIPYWERSTINKSVSNYSIQTTKAWEENRCCNRGHQRKREEVIGKGFLDKVIVKLWPERWGKYPVKSGKRQKTEAEWESIIE